MGREERGWRVGEESRIREVWGRRRDGERLDKGEGWRGRKEEKWRGKGRKKEWGMKNEGESWKWDRKPGGIGKKGIWMLWVAIKEGVWRKDLIESKETWQERCCGIGQEDPSTQGKGTGWVVPKLDLILPMDNQTQPNVKVPATSCSKCFNLQGRVEAGSCLKNDIEVSKHSSFCKKINCLAISEKVINGCL